jgi:membrane protease YdiL (CAAX protease family)
MDQAPITAGFWLAAIVAVSAVASLATLFRLFVRHIDGQPLLPHEPRRPVPWNFIAPLLLLGPPAIGIINGITGHREEPPEPAYFALPAAYAATAAATGPAPWGGSLLCAASAVHVAEQLNDAAGAAAKVWQTAVASILLALACYAILAALFGAMPHDLGLPSSWRQTGRDCWIGAVAFIASLAPIYALMAALALVFEPKDGHPLIEQFIVNPSLSLMAATAAAAVISAPLFEETAFRLVFQGWLERWMLPRTSSPLDEQFESSAGDGPPPPVAQHPAGGWTAIGISSVLFGLAHWGQGVAPVPLILLGVIMGYLYQRTHRVLPAMVCHLLFNAYSLGLVWLQFGPS